MNQLNRQTKLCAVAMLLSVCLLKPAAAQVEPSVRIAALVTSLSDESFARRQQAEAALLQEGSQADQYLRQALSSSNPELRQRAENLLRRRLVNSVWAPTMLEFAQRQACFAEVIQPFADSWGMSITRYHIPQRETNTYVELPQEQLALMRVVSILQDHTCSHRQVVARAFNGPVMLELVSASQQADTLELALDFRLLWEPKLSLVSHCELPSSVRLTLSEGEQVTAAQGEIQWHTTDHNAKPVRATLRIPLAAPLDGLPEVRVVWPLCAAAVRGTTTIPQPVSGRQIATEAGEITIAEYDHQAMTIVVENIRSWPEPAEALLRNYQWRTGSALRYQLTHCELTPGGARWQLRAPHGHTPPVLQVDYRSEFTRKDLEFVFEHVDVDE